MEAIKGSVLASIALALLAGCSSAPPAVTTPATVTTAGAQSNAPLASTATKPAAPSTLGASTLPEYLDPKNPLSTQRSVYFDFDDYSVKPEYVPILEGHGRYLASHLSVSIRVEGNTDERGSSEYNLALGQKRAQVVLNALKLYGAKEGQMEAISWGKERPKATGHDEASMAQNRRTDLAYPVK